MAVSIRSALLFAAVTVAAAGCGAGAHRAAPPPPKLPHVLAAQLALLSNQVAAQLSSDDSCGAFDTAKRLDSQAADAIARGQVPLALQQPLRTAADDLVSRIQCTPPPSPPPPQQEHGKEKHHKHKGHGGGGD